MGEIVVTIWRNLLEELGNVVEEIPEIPDHFLVTDIHGKRTVVHSTSETAFSVVQREIPSDVTP